MTKTKFAALTLTNLLQSFCLQWALYLKYCNTIRSTVSQYSLSIVKIKFPQHDKLEKRWQDVALWEKATIHHMSDLESDSEEGMFSRTLAWRDDDSNQLIHRCHASISLMRKHGDVSATPKPPDHN